MMPSVSSRHGYMVIILLLLLLLLLVSDSCLVYLGIFTLFFHSVENETNSIWICLEP